VSSVKGREFKKRRDAQMRTEECGTTTGAQPPENEDSSGLEGGEEMTRTS
jgi:hypothetical protein